MLAKKPVAPDVISKWAIRHSIQDEDFKPPKCYGWMPASSAGQEEAEKTQGDQQLYERFCKNNSKTENKRDNSTDS